jgi:alkanesulfonate monooxygenase SsuD/methylene tetrahydromethanopterin reductase-like flavin-dependent oxidoreductase (luciferase family)
MHPTAIAMPFLPPVARALLWVLLGTPEEVRERMQAYRKTGMTLSIITPAVEPEGSVEQAMEVLRACAPPA